MFYTGSIKNPLHDSVFWEGICSLVTRKLWKMLESCCQMCINLVNTYRILNIMVILILTTQTLVWILFREFKEVIFLPNTFLTVRSKAAREMWHIAGESKFSPKSKAPWAGHGWIVQSQVYFCPCGITSLCAKLLVWKYDVTCTVIRMKIESFSWFSWETFCTSTRSANGSSDGGSQSRHTLFFVL